MDNFNLKAKIKEHNTANKPITLICELCQEPYAIVFKEELRLPLTGDMFHSHLPPDVPDPFLVVPGNPPILWEDMWCPYGRNHKPFLQADTLTLADGSLFVVTGKAFKVTVATDEPWVHENPQPKVEPKAVSRPKKVKPPPIKCRFCGDKFTAKTSKYRHEENSCKKRPRR